LTQNLMLKNTSTSKHTRNSGNEKKPNQIVCFCSVHKFVKIYCNASASLVLCSSIELFKNLRPGLISLDVDTFVDVLHI